MADLSITAASITAGTGAVVTQGTAGATITQGQVVYLDSATTTYKLADANASAAAASAVGVALQSVASGQPVSIITQGPLNGGFTATVGESYFVSGTAGGIAPSADVAAGWYTGFLGVALTATQIYLRPYISGVAHA